MKEEDRGSSFWFDRNIDIIIQNCTNVENQEVEETRISFPDDINTKELNENKSTIDGDPREHLKLLITSLKQIDDRIRETEAKNQTYVKCLENNVNDLS